MDDQNDSVLSPQVLLFSLPGQHTINFTIPIFKTFNSRPNFPLSQPPRQPHQHTATSSRHTVTVGTCRQDRHLHEPDTCTTYPPPVDATYPHSHPHFPLPSFISHLVMLKSVLVPQLFELPFAATTLPQLFSPSVPRIIIIGVFGVFQYKHF